MEKFWTYSGHFYLKNIKYNNIQIYSAQFHLKNNKYGKNWEKIIPLPEASNIDKPQPKPKLGLQFFHYRTNCPEFQDKLGKNQNFWTNKYTNIKQATMVPLLISHLVGSLQP